MKHEIQIMKLMHTDCKSNFFKEGFLMTRMIGSSIIDLKRVFLAVNYSMLAAGRTA